MTNTTTHIGYYLKSGEKVAATPFNSQRAKEIIHSAQFGEYSAQMTSGEIEYTKAIWKTMPGYTCFYDALCKIAQGRVPQECESCGGIGFNKIIQINPHTDTAAVDYKLCEQCQK